AFSWALVAEHRAYNSNAYDLGFFDQIIWNTAHGRWFQTSFVAYNFTGQHLEPVLLLFAALSRFWPGVEPLLLVQATVVAWAAVPLYLAARRLFASTTAALAVGVAYLLAPHLHSAVLDDFHPEVMGAAGIFGALAFLLAGRPGWGLVALGSLFLLKEDVALAGAGFATIFWLRGYRRHSVWLLLTSVLYLVLIVGVLMTVIRGGAGNDLLGRYAYLVPGASTGPGRLVEFPRSALSQLTGAGQIGGLVSLLAPLVFLPLAGPAVLAALPVLAANLFASHGPQSALTAHYGAVPFALLLVAALLGIDALARSRRLERIWVSLHVAVPHRSVVLAGALLLGQALAFLLTSPLGLHYTPAQYQQTAHTDAVTQVLRAIPQDAPVSAQSGLLPHLSERRQVQEFPRLRDAAYVVVDQKAWRSSQSVAAGYDLILKLLPQAGFCQSLEQDGVVLYSNRHACASQ
ncbi:MAG TPA: DUF2079 domain-containing protein, partial [Chloroflexota bacterium]